MSISPYGSKPLLKKLLTLAQRRTRIWQREGARFRQRKMDQIFSRITAGKDLLYLVIIKNHARFLA